MLTHPTHNRFMDVATRHDTLWPKVATLHAASMGWVHLARALHAVPLFGVGFGELFRPVSQRGPAMLYLDLLRPYRKGFPGSLRNRPGSDPEAGLEAQDAVAAGWQHTLARTRWFSLRALPVREQRRASCCGQTNAR